MTKQPHKADRVGEAPAEFLAYESTLGPHAMQAAEEGRAPCADGEQASEEDDGIDAFAPGTGPVGAWLEIEPEREFVESQSCAHTIADGHKPAVEDRELSMVVPEVEQPSVTDQEEDDDAPHKVMDVMAAHRDPLEWAGLVDDGADQKAYASEGKKERDGGEKRAPARPVWDGGADEEPNPGELKQHEQNNNDKGGKGQQYKGSVTGHNLLWLHCFRMGMGGRNILNKRALCHDFSLQWRGTLVKASRPDSFRNGRALLSGLVHARVIWHGSLGHGLLAAVRFRLGDLRCELLC